MSESSGLYTDRVNGPRPRTAEALSDLTREGLKALLVRRADGNWLAQEFPAFCPDGNGITGTNYDALGSELAAVVPGAEWPLWQDAVTDGGLFDVVEYFGRRIAKPSEGHWHSFFNHHELAFDAKSGRAEFARDVNEILARGGTVYELSPQMQVRRVGSPEVRAALSALRPDSGDSELDDLIEQGRELYGSRDAKERATGVEKLWDGFERLKELESPGNKKAGATKLLAHIQEPAFRDVVEAEMTALTKLGNQFRIRHHEPSKVTIPDDARDYVAARMANLLTFLLDQSGRLTRD